MLKYMWNADTDGIYKKADAEKVANEIFSIVGDITNAKIVEKARDENTELHKLIEWDDSKAAEKYREVQAGRVVCNLKVIEVKDYSEKADEETKIVPVRVFQHLNTHPGYVPITVIVKDEDKYAQLLQQAREELERFKAKYNMLTELKEIFDLI